jgi:MFS family permease
MQTAYMGGFVLAPFLLDSEFGYTAGAITLVMVARPITFSACGPFSSRVAVRFGERLTGIFGTSSMALSMAVLAYGAATKTIILVILGLMMSGAGNGFSQPPFQASMANSVDEADLGIASAAKNVVGTIGSSLGITLMTTLRSSGGSTSAGFATAFWAGAAIAAVAVVLAFQLEDTRRGTDEEMAEMEVDPAPAPGLVGP